MIKGRVAELLGRDVGTLERCSAAQGCACIAEDVFKGCKDILGLEVDERVRELPLVNYSQKMIFGFG